MPRGQRRSRLHADSHIARCTAQDPPSQAIRPSSTCQRDRSRQRPRASHSTISSSRRCRPCRAAALFSSCSARCSRARARRSPRPRRRLGSAPRAAVSGLRARVALLGLRPPPRSAVDPAGRGAARRPRPSAGPRAAGSAARGGSPARGARRAVAVGLQPRKRGPHRERVSSAQAPLRPWGRRLAPLRLPASPEVSARARFARGPFLPSPRLASRALFPSARACLTPPAGLLPRRLPHAALGPALGRAPARARDAPPRRPAVVLELVCAGTLFAPRIERPRELGRLPAARRSKDVATSRRERRAPARGAGTTTRATRARFVRGIFVCMFSLPRALATTPARLAAPGNAQALAGPSGARSARPASSPRARAADAARTPRGRRAAEARTALARSARARHRDGLRAREAAAAAGARHRGRRAPAAARRRRRGRAAAAAPPSGAGAVATSARGRARARASALAQARPKNARAPRLLFTTPPRARKTPLARAAFCLFFSLCLLAVSSSSSSSRRPSSGCSVLLRWHTHRLLHNLAAGGSSAAASSRSA